MAEVDPRALAMMVADLLTTRQTHALRLMRDREEGIVYERGQCWVDDEKFGPKTFFTLVRLMAISREPGTSSGGYEFFTLNETGRQALALIEAPDFKRPRHPRASTIATMRMVYGL